MSMLASLSNFAEKTILQNSFKISVKVLLGCIFIYVKFDQNLSFSFPIQAPRVGVNALLLCNLVHHKILDLQHCFKMCPIS